MNVNCNFSGLGLFVGFGTHTSGYTNVTNVSISGYYNSSTNSCSLMFSNVYGNVSFTSLKIIATYNLNGTNSSILVIYHSNGNAIFTNILLKVNGSISNLNYFGYNFTFGMNSSNSSIAYIDS